MQTLDTVAPRNMGKCNSWALASAMLEIQGKLDKEPSQRAVARRQTPHKHHPHKHHCYTPHRTSVHKQFRRQGCQKAASTRATVPRA